MVPCFRLTIVLAKYPTSEGTTIYHWSQRPMADPGAWSEGRLLSIGDVTRSCTDQDGNYELSKVNVEVSDGDGMIRTLLSESPTQFWTGREATIEVLSEAGRAADLEWRPVFRGVISAIQLRPGHKAALEISDLIGSKFSSFDLERTLSVKLGGEHLNLPASSVGKIYPLIVGEHSDKGAVTKAGEVAEKGLLPVIDTGDYTFDGSAPTFLPPPSNVWGNRHGAGGSETYSYCITTGNSFGESTKSATVVITGCPKSDDFTEDDYNEIGWDPVEGATFYRVWGRTSTNRWLDGMNNGNTFVDPETYYRDDDDHDVEKSGPNVGENTASDAWGRMLVSLGVTDVHDVYAANVEHDAPVARIKLTAAQDGVEFLTADSADWPHPDRFIELRVPETGSLIRMTVIYLRGHRLTAHRSGAVTIAVNACGMESVGDGTGTMVDQAFMAGQLFINEHILKHKGAGYRYGDYGGTERFENEDPQLQTSAWQAAQDVTIARIGGPGYIAAWAIYEEMTVREWVHRFCLTFDCRLAANHFGQIYPIVVDDLASTTTGHLYREREEDVTLVDHQFAHAELENSITFNYDWDSDAKKYRYTDRIIWDAESIAANVPGKDFSNTSDPKGTYHGPVQELFCTRDTATANDSRARRLTRNKRVPRYLTISQNLSGLGDDLGAQIRITHRDGIGPDGDFKTPAVILKHTVRAWGDIGTQLVALDVLKFNENVVWMPAGSEATDPPNVSDHMELR